MHLAQRGVPGAHFCEQRHRRKSDRMTLTEAERNSPLSWFWERNKLAYPVGIEFLRGAAHLHARQARLADIDAGGGEEDAEWVAL